MALHFCEKIKEYVSNKRINRAGTPAGERRKVNMNQGLVIESKQINNQSLGFPTGSELVVEADADDVVRAGVGLCAGVGRALVVGLGAFGVVAVERAEVADVEAHLLVDVPGAAEAYRVAVAGEGCVLLVGVAEAVVRALATTADGELLVDVVFHTCEDLVGAVVKRLLTATIHLGVLVVEEVIFEGGAEVGRELIADSGHQE